MIIPIKTKEEDFYQMVLLKIVSNFYPFNKLVRRESQVFGWLSYFYNKLKEEGYSENKINSILFGPDLKIKISNLIVNDAGKKLSISHYNNLKSHLHKKGFILREDGQEKLNKKYVFSSNKMKEITFKFEINE